MHYPAKFVSDLGDQKMPLIPAAVCFWTMARKRPVSGSAPTLGCRRVRPAPDLENFERPLAGFFQSPREGAWRCARDPWVGQASRLTSNGLRSRAGRPHYIPEVHK